MENLIIIGTGTNARHVYKFIQTHNLYNVIAFAVSEEYKTSDSFLDKPLYSLETLESECKVPFKVFVALLWNRLNADRKKLYDYCKERGWQMANLISPTAIIRGNINGDNCWIHDYVVVQNDANIGSDIAIMAFTLIGADTIIGNHCFFGARSLLGGGSKIGEQSFVGINAVIFDDTLVGRKCIIGSCTAVKRNLPDCTKISTTLDSYKIKSYPEDIIESKLMFSKNVR